jgi:hypothetical protein
VPGIAELLEHWPRILERVETGRHSDQVDDRLGGDAGDRGRSDMMHFDQGRPDGLQDARLFLAGLLGPLGVMGN